MGRAGRLSKPELAGSHGKLNAALHELHKGAGLMSLSSMARQLEGAGISRSTIYAAFCGKRLPKWEVVDALVEILATRHPRTSPEGSQPRLYDLWLRAVDEEPEQEDDAESAFPVLPPLPPIPSPLAALREVAARVWLDVPYEDRDEARALGACWDEVQYRWYAEHPGPELMRWRADE